MISKVITIISIEELRLFLQTEEVGHRSKQSSSVLVQIFSSERNPQWMAAIADTIRGYLPQTVIVGASTMGEIVGGKLNCQGSVLSFSFFEATALQGYFIPGKDENRDLIALGRQFAQKIESDCREIAGILILATPFTMNISCFLKGFSAGRMGTYPVFGGGAGDYNAAQEPLIMLDGHNTSMGALAVVFMGREIAINVHTYLGWQPLSKQMTITKTDGRWVKTIDDQPAFEVFHRYLDIRKDADFFFNMMEFPLLLNRNGIDYAKSPMEVNDENAIKFIAEMREGESVCIGYGNPAMMIEKANDIQNRIQTTNPDAIFLFSCVCRRYLLQNEVDLETKPFQIIAPTCGFYTYGEIFSQGRRVMLLNATMVAVSMKEGQGSSGRSGIAKIIPPTESFDPFTSQHTRIISRLVNFIRVVTEELEEANAEARRLAEQDYLTKAFNRMKAHNFLEYEMERAKRYHSIFSVIMLDVDYFKRVNDTYGHNVGDAVLIHLVKLISLEIRKIDLLSRWGGEEFLIIMPETDQKGAKITAERIRAVVELSLFPSETNQTCSFGVTTYFPGESIPSLIDRVDKALYEAKSNGRNQVVAK